MTIRPTIIVLLALPLLIAGGCESVKHLATSLDPGGSRSDQRSDPRVYPEYLPLGDELAIEVRRVDREHIRIDNRTAVPYTQVPVWINETYGQTLEEIPLGESKPIALVGFINQFGEQYPVGSLLAPEQSRTVVSAVLVIDGERRPLGIRLPDDWQYR